MAFNPIDKIMGVVIRFLPGDFHGCLIDFFHGDILRFMWTS